MVARWRNPTSTSLLVTTAGGDTVELKPRQIITGDFYKDQGLEYVDDAGIGIDLSDHPGIAEVIGQDTRIVGDRVASQNTLAFNLEKTGDPTGTDSDFPIGTRWFNVSTGVSWRLSSITGNVATWTRLSAKQYLMLRYSYQYTANPGVEWFTGNNITRGVSPVNGVITRAHVVIRNFTFLSDFQILKNDVVEFTYLYDSVAVNAQGVSVREFEDLNISVTTEDVIKVRTGPDNGTLHQPTATLFIEY